MKMRIILTGSVVLLGVIVDTLCSTCTIDNRNLYVDQSYQPEDQCKQYTCFENGFLAEVPCPDIRPKDGCEFIPMSPLKKFPMCCPHYDCSK